MSTQISLFHSWVLRVLAHYELVEPEVTFIGHNENISFRVHERIHHSTYLLRIHKPISSNYSGLRQHPNVIESELLWLDALHRDTPLTVQQPVRNAHGDLVTMPETDDEIIPCTLLRWIEGDTFYPDGPEAPTLVAQLGTVVAHLHDYAAHWSQPEEFSRPIYDSAFFHSQLTLLAHGITSGVIAENDYSEIAKVIETLPALLVSIQKDREHWGIIHNDLQGSNILVWQGDIRPIDFSLCGFSYYLNDLGTTLSGLAQELRPSFLAGYRTLCRVDDADLRLVDGFFLLSRLGAYIFMLVDQANQEWLRERIPRFVMNECHSFMREQPLLFSSFGG